MKNVARSLILAFLLLATLIIAITLFTIAGMMIGGNYAEQFQAFGLRGYEATGMVGTLVGIALGLIADYLLLRTLLRTRFFRFD